jgi:DNA polymerase/3'-5' exonuclease PolX
MKTAFKLAEMQKRAAEIVELITPFCEKVEIAGSIRRQKATVSDIEIIYIPKYEDESRFSLFNDKQQKLASNMRIYLQTAPDFKRRLNKLGYTTFGGKIQLMLYKSKYPVDFFATNEEGWALTKLIRTGSKEFNIFLINEALLNGYKVSVENNCIIKTDTNENIYFKTEEEIFSLLGLDYLPPENRNALQKFKRDYR